MLKEAKQTLSSFSRPYNRLSDESPFTNEGLPGVLGNKGTEGKYSREQGNMTPVLGNT